MNTPFFKRTLALGIIAFILFAATAFSQTPNYSSSDAQKALLPHSPEAESLGKFGDIPVGLYTGVPNISIPIYALKMKGLTVPISIDYHSSGIKVDEIASNVGLGWALNAGGLINQIVYGMNDLGSDGSGGWFDPVASTRTPLATSLLSDFFDNSGFQTDSAYMFNKNVADGLFDTQPDIFSFSFPGKSGKFFFDQNKGIHLVPVQNLKVEYIPGSGSLNPNFIITDEHGNKFYFASIEQTTTTTINCTTSVGASPIQMTSTLYLSKIVTPTNEEVDFHYDNVSYSIQNQIAETRYWYSNDGKPQFAQYNFIPNCTVTSSSLVASLRLSYINNVTTGDRVVFTYGASRTDLPGTNVLDRVEVFNGGNVSVKRFDLTHDYYVSSGGPTTDLNNHLRLTSIQQNGQQPYLFTYNSTTLAPRLSLSQDHWGYYNGSSNTTLLPIENRPEFQTGANREIDTVYSKAGILTKVQYPTGGSTAFSYEQNDSYVDQFQQTYHSTGAGAGAIVNGTRTINFTVPDSSTNFKASWVTSADSSQIGQLSPTGDNTTIVLTGPSGYSLNFTGNNQNYTIFSGNGGVNGTSLIPGNYTITITNTSSTGTANGALSIIWIYPTTQHIQQNVPGGGLRIKTTVDYPVTGTPLVKHYEYASVSDPTKSSGILRYKPSYDYTYNKYQVTTIGSVTQNSTTTTYSFVLPCAYIAQGSGSLTPLGTVQGGNVIYSNVNVYTGDKTNGYTSNQFTSGGLTGAFLGDTSSNFPFPPSIVNDWIDGLPTTTTQYKYQASNGTYFPISIDQKAYKTMIGDGTSTYNNTGFGSGNESYARGIKLSYSFPEWVGGATYFPDLYTHKLPALFAIGYYHLYSSWYHLDQETNTQYDQNGSNPVVATSNYYYDNPTHTQLTRTVTTKSNGKVITSAVTYPDDYATGTTFLDNMKTNHLTADPVEQVAYQYDGTNTGILGGSVIRYKTGGKGFIDTVYKMENVAPVSLASFKFSNAATGQYSFGNTPGTYSFDSRYKPRLTYNQYDTLGNPLMLTQTGSVPVSYQWGYSKTYPVAQVANAPVNDIFYDSFEEGNGTSTVGDAKTGHYSYSGTYTKALAGLDEGNYILSYWQKNSSGIWVLMSSTVTAGGSYTITLTGPIDDVRFYPVGAQMTTYTFDPLIGMTSSADAKNEISYYEYDSFHRLMNIKDKDGNIIKHMDYHYQGQ